MFPFDDVIMAFVELFKMLGNQRYAYMKNITMTSHERLGVLNRRSLDCFKQCFIQASNK